MRVVTETGSRRKLTSRRLIVDWNGCGTLFFTMTKRQMRDVFAGVKIITVQGKHEFQGRFSPLKKEETTFKIKRNQYGWVAIGCERFIKEEVKELKKWCKQ